MTIASPFLHNHTYDHRISFSLQGHTYDHRISFSLQGRTIRPLVLLFFHLHPLDLCDGSETRTATGWASYPRHLRT